MRPWSLFIVVALVLAGGVALAAAPGSPDEDAPKRPPVRRTGTTTTVPATNATGHLEAIARAAREHGGHRAAGSAGERASVAYVRRRLRAAGYEVRLQRFTIPYFEETSPPVVRIVGAGGSRLRARRDVTTIQYSGIGEASGRLRVAGRLALGSASAAGCAPGDFAGVRRGDVVLVQRGTCTLEAKARSAQRAGAGAVLIANDGRGDGRTSTFAGTFSGPGVRIPALIVSSAAARRLAAVAGAGGDRRVSVKVRGASERRSTVNVIADAPRPAGSAAPRRVVMAGAHLDSVSAGPGINDNGSGVAVLLAAAEQHALRGTQNLRVAFWGAEELGLVGSRRYVRSLPEREHRRVTAYLNFDMVGSPNAVPRVYADGPRAARLERVLRRAYGKPLAEWSGRASDHASFLRAGITAGGLFTGASEVVSKAQARRYGADAGKPADRCYHRRCDGVQNVDHGVLADMERAATAAIAELAPAR